MLMSKCEYIKNEYEYKNNYINWYINGNINIIYRMKI